VQGKEVPVPRQNRVLTQLPPLRQKFTDYESDAEATISDVLSERQREEATVMRATRFASSYLENRGDGQFRIRPLPTRAQLGPLYGLLAEDVTGDGHLDLLAVGNSYAPDVITGRHDALIGVLLRGDGDGHFETVSHRESGFFVDGDVKGLVRLHGADGTPTYVATQNDDTTRTFKERDRSSQVSFSPSPNEAYAEVTYSDGTVQRRELYYGEGYLSQSSRRLYVPKSAVKVTFYTYGEITRTVTVP